MRNLGILFVPVIATLARLWGPGGIRSVVAESVLVKQQRLILNRSRQRSPHLRTSDRLVAGLCALLIRPARLIRAAIVLRPSTLLSLHQALRNRKYRRLFSSQRRGRPGPKGPTKELIGAVVQMKQRNPTWGCPRIAQPTDPDLRLPATGSATTWGAAGERIWRQRFGIAFIRCPKEVSQRGQDSRIARQHGTHRSPVRVFSNMESCSIYQPWL